MNPKSENEDENSLKHSKTYSNINDLNIDNKKDKNEKSAKDDSYKNNKIMEKIKIFEIFYGKNNENNKINNKNNNKPKELKNNCNKNINQKKFS